MVRHRLQTGSVGPVGTTWVGVNGAGREVAIGVPKGSGFYPREWRVGDTVMVDEGSGGRVELTAWRGLVRVRDVDGQVYMVRRWKGTKAGAIAATERAGKEKLEALKAGRDRAAAAAVTQSLGDTDTTVGSLVVRALDQPTTQKLAPRTREAYRATARHVAAHDPTFVDRLPREVDVADVRILLTSFAGSHKSSSTSRAKALLARAFDLAIEDRDLQVRFNPVRSALGAIPSIQVRNKTLETRRAPTTQELTAFLRNLAADPLSGQTTGSRLSGSNGTDVSDLLQFAFQTGCRIGEIIALRWKDVDLVENYASINGSLSYVTGVGLVRGPTKTASAKRDIPLSEEAARLLVERAAQFGMDLTNPKTLETPVFGSPQKREAWRDPSNTAKAIRKAFDRNGLPWASSHTGRRWRVTSLLERQIPLGQVSDYVGHANPKVTFGYIGRGRLVVLC